MVAQGLIALALALPTGMLFGVGYGTGVRIGYEQVYPLLFPKSKENNADQVKENLQSINRIYDSIGGKEASNMGIAMGLNSIRTSTENNPDFRYLEELELRISGRTPSSLDPRSNSPTTTSSHHQESSEEEEPHKHDNEEDTVTEDGLSLEDKVFLMNQINAATLPELMEMRKRYTDPNLQQLIVAEINKINAELKKQNQFGNTVPKTPVVGTSITVKDSYVRAQYQNSIFTRKKELVASRQTLANALLRVKNAGRTPANLAAVTRTEAKIKRQVQAFINFITISRNNIKLKSLANPDWNNRVWK